MNNQNRELPQNAILYVAKPRSGYTGDFATLQEAIDAIPEGNTTPVTIYLRPGTYREAVRISGDKPYITLVGEGETPEEVCIAYDNYAGRKRENGDMTGTFRSATVSVYANHFTAKNLTFAIPLTAPETWAAARRWPSTGPENIWYSKTAAS